MYIEYNSNQGKYTIKNLKLQRHVIYLRINFFVVIFYDK